MVEIKNNYLVNRASSFKSDGGTMKSSHGVPIGPPVCRGTEEINGRIGITESGMAERG